MPARSSSAAARASWDLDMDVFLVEVMTDQAKAGERADSGFKKEAWVAVHESMNERFNKELTIQEIKTRVQTLKSKYTTISHMLRVSSLAGIPTTMSYSCTTTGFKFNSRSSGSSKRGNSRISYVNRSERPEGRQQERFPAERKS
eukprot:jgi/Phyca11/6054/fgenesh1_pm.PHYCAscaffold_9_\